MKILMVNTEESRGGAARMASLLKDSINKSKKNCAILMHSQNNVKKKDSIGIHTAWVRYLNVFLARIGGSLLVYDNGFSGHVISMAAKYDLIHLHNLHGYYLDWKKLFNELKGKPVVWTWHDQWGATGRCGFAIDCDGWKDGCGDCNNREYYPKAWFDWSGKEYYEKTRIYNIHKNIHIVSPSRWLADIAVERGIEEERVHVIPNPVDVENYIRYKKRDARKQIGLPLNEYVVLFIAADCNDARKGYIDFEHIVKGLGIHPIVVGGEPKTKNSGICYVGELRDKNRLSLYYSAADIMVFTSKADNYPNTIIECLLCGTPVCAYSVGGVPSQLPEKYCRLVEYGDEEGIREVLKKKEKKDEIQSEYLFSYSHKKWGSPRIAQKYISLYQKLINGNPPENS